MMPKNYSFVLLLLALASSFGSALDDNNKVDENEVHVHVSQECATVLVASGILAGVGITSLAPGALCTLGFCSMGVAGNSVASFWQSTMATGISAGSLFAKLQSLAMAGGAAGNVYFAASALGGAAGAALINDFCATVDAAEPGSLMGRTVEGSRKAVTKFHEFQTQCRSSETCTWTVDTASYLVSSATTAAKAHANELQNHCKSSQTCSATVDAAADLASAATATARQAKDYAVAQLTSPENHQAVQKGLAATRDYASALWDSFLNQERADSARDS